MKEVKGCAKILTGMVYVFVAQTIECRATSALHAPPDMQTEQGTIQEDLILSAIYVLRTSTSQLPTHVRHALEHQRD